VNIILRGAVNRKNIFRLCLLLFSYYPLHVSEFMAHLQVFCNLNFICNLY
jgi:hypothetical protein